jgi:hypothetical protein
MGWLSVISPRGERSFSSFSASLSRKKEEAGQLVLISPSIGSSPILSRTSTKARRNFFALTKVHLVLTEED